MKQIISASRRTDIPAFYGNWFMDRIREGYCTYPNPLYPKQIHRVDLTPDAVAGIVFWTRNAKPMLRHLDELSRRGYCFYFLYTVVNYPRSVDPRSPSYASAAETMRRLADGLGRNRVVWRYDPVILNSTGVDLTWHKENFGRLLGVIGGVTSKVILSVVDPYKKTTRRLGDETDGVHYAPAEYLDLLRWMVHSARSAGLAAQSCAEELLDVDGLTPGPCIDADLIADLSGDRVSRAHHKQRPGCLCHRSVDIGVNNTCGFGCAYCYATSDHARALENVRRHRSDWPCLAGRLDVPPLEQRSTSGEGSDRDRPEQLELFPR